MAGKDGFLSSWRERLVALRNVPPVLKIVWESGRGIVAFGIIARIVAALLPIAIGYIPKLIIDILDQLIKTHGPVPTKLWWLLGAEFALAVLSSLLVGATTNWTRHLAIRNTHHLTIRG